MKQTFEMKLTIRYVTPSEEPNSDISDVWVKGRKGGRKESSFLKF